MPNYQDQFLPKETRNQPTTGCFCYICLTAKKRGALKKTKHGRDKKCIPLVEIGPNNGQINQISNQIFI